jgi:hypothetical protein
MDRWDTPRAIVGVVGLLVVEWHAHALPRGAYLRVLDLRSRPLQK